MSIHCRTLSLLVTSGMVLGLAACGGDESPPDASLSTQADSAALVTSPVGQQAPDASTLPRWDPPVSTPAPPLPGTPPPQAGYSALLNCASGVPIGPLYPATVAYDAGSLSVTDATGTALRAVSTGVWTAQRSGDGITYGADTAVDVVRRLFIHVHDNGQLDGGGFDGANPAHSIHCGVSLAGVASGTFYPVGDRSFAWHDGLEEMICQETVDKPDSFSITQPIPTVIRFIANGRPTTAFEGVAYVFPSAAEFAGSSPLPQTTASIEPLISGGFRGSIRNTGNASVFTRIDLSQTYELVELVDSAIGDTPDSIRTLRCSAQ